MADMPRWMQEVEAVLQSVAPLTEVVRYRALPTARTDTLRGPREAGLIVQMSWRRFSVENVDAVSDRLALMLGHFPGFAIRVELSSDGRMWLMYVRWLDPTGESARCGIVGEAVDEVEQAFGGPGLRVEPVVWDDDADE